MIKAPETISVAQLKLLGLSFPGYFYTEYAERATGTIWTANQNADHTHDGSVSGTTGNNSQNHTHIANVPSDQGTHITQENNVDHNHTFSDSLTTGSQSADHKHSYSVTLPGSTQKTTFTGSLLEVHVSANMVDWTEITQDFSGLFATTGTGMIDISSFLTANAVNYLRISLNTATVIGGKICHLLEIS